MVHRLLEVEELWPLKRGRVEWRKVFYLEVGLGHLQDAGGEVTKAVDQVGGIVLVELLPGQIGVVGRVHVAEK